jgi:hypothetical protein
LPGEFSPLGELTSQLIERKLARRHLAPEANPRRMALFDLSSSWLEGSHCPLGTRGYSRDGKKGNVQIEHGLSGRRDWADCLRRAADLSVGAVEQVTVRGIHLSPRRGRH